ncbi:MAG: glycosyltransferase family 2 protein [Chloroflexi bacterium]|nr:glycosyltransferase family 2 protein [Chloroflexota bacterium]
MNLGIIIVSYNVHDLLRQCLQSVFAELERSPALRATVVVVDNASSDHSASMVAATFPQARLIASDENMGFAAGNNRGLQALGFGPAAKQMSRRPQAVLLLNPDTEIQPGALVAMTDFLARSSRAGGCGARLNYADGSFQHSAFHFPGLIQLVLDLFPPGFPGARHLLNSSLNGRYARALYEGGQPFAIDFALGAALMVRAEVIDAVGLLDEGYFMYAEEMDWCQRMHAAGWQLSCVPTAHITHHEGRSARQFRSQMLVALWRSRVRYYRRYYPAWKRALAYRIIARGMQRRRQQALSAHQRQTIDDATLQGYLQAVDSVLSLLKP